MANRKFLSKFFKEEKTDRKKEIRNTYRRFCCDHKVKEKGDEVSLLKVVEGDGGEKKLKCENCKKKLPAKPYTTAEIREAAKVMINGIEMLKAAVPNPSEEWILEIADYELFIHLFGEMYEAQVLNRAASRFDEEDSSGNQFDMSDSEIMYINSGRDGDDFGWKEKKDKKHSKKNKGYEKKNKNIKGKGGKNRPKSIIDFYR